jgi:hypothetical protein
MNNAERLEKYDTLLTAVMPADFKDWHENSKNEWPEIAAHVITNLRSQRDDLQAENEALRVSNDKLVQEVGESIADKADLFRIYEQRCAELDAAMKVEQRSFGELHPRTERSHKC